jgi:DNA-directed RNA polymerase III subunit RPC2
VKGMGMETDQEIIQLVGSEQMFVDGLSASLEDCAAHKIFNQQQALDYIGTKIKAFKKNSFWGYKKTKVPFLHLFYI